jgi:hypothetical protein
VDLLCNPRGEPSAESAEENVESQVQLHKEESENAATSFRLKCSRVSPPQSNFGLKNSNFESETVS